MRRFAHKIDGVEPIANSFMQSTGRNSRGIPIPKPLSFCGGRFALSNGRAHSPVSILTLGRIQESKRPDFSFLDR